MVIRPIPRRTPRLSGMIICMGFGLVASRKGVEVVEKIRGPLTRKRLGPLMRQRSYDHTV